MVGLNCDVLQAIPGGMPAQVSLQRQEELHVTLARDDMLYIIHHPGNPVTLVTLGTRRLS